MTRRVSRFLQAAGAAAAVGLVLVTAFYAAGVSAEVRGVSDFTRDPTDVAEVPWWVGALSRLTNLGWVVAATAALLSRRHAAAAHRLPLALLGGLCTVIALDDTLLLHEEVLPSLGLPEDPFLVLYVVAGVALGVVWLRTLWRTVAGLAFLAGAAMLALSVFVDAFLARVVVEDTAKLIGAVAWILCAVWAHSDLAVSPAESEGLSARTP